jgi:AcrR family transcriptional regulator
VTSLPRLDNLTQWSATMTDRSPAPQPRRSYHSPIRAAGAAGTRERLLDASAASFARAGYAATTVRQIAERAKVSVQSAHLAGPKSALLIAAFTREVDSMRPPQGLEPGADAVAQVVDFGVELAARIAPLWRAVEEASRYEPLVEAEYPVLREKSDAALVAVLPALRIEGARRDDILAEIRFALSPAAYLYFVIEQGWDLERYRARTRLVVSTLLRAA